MICPHCGEENLVGAVNCMACGGSMFAIPGASVGGDGAPSVPQEPPVSRRMVAAPFEDEPKRPPKPAGPVTLRCRICLEPFERPASQPGVDACPSCRNIAAAGGDLGENEIQFAYQPDVHDEYVSRLGKSGLRPPREMKLKLGVRWGRVAILLGILLSLVGAAVVRLMPETDQTSIYFRDLREVESDLVVDPPEDKILSIQSDFNLYFQYERMKASFTGELVPRIKLDQHSRHTCQLQRQRETPHGVLVNLHTENKLIRQTGVEDNKEITGRDYYPWDGRSSTHKAVVSIDKPARTETGSLLEPGFDVAPLLTLAAVGAPDAVVRPGKKWLAGVELPLLASPRVGIVQANFPCRVYYQGRKLVDGYDCVALKITGENTHEPPELLESMNRTGGQLLGALFYDAKTGLIVRAHVNFDFWVARDRGRLEERVITRGQLRIER